MKTFSFKKNMRKSVACEPALQEILRNIFQEVILDGNSDLQEMKKWK